MNVTTKNLIPGLALAALLSGCATVAPVQLLEARRAYATSNQGMAARLTPSDLHEAKMALDDAEHEFSANGDTPELQDYAYIAQRKIELADAKARTELDRRRIAEAVEQGAVAREALLKGSQDALARSREQIMEERNASGIVTSELEGANKAQGKKLAKTAAELAAEKNARTTAEAKLAKAMKDLATIAAVKEEARGMVITLNGSVLFASNQHVLLETAKTKLDQVAEALMAQNDDRLMIIEGHTDSQGSDAINLPLSLNRARAVRDYLIGRGVDAKKVKAIGLGSSRPLLDNQNPENRANNRRVEIIIEPARLARLSAR